MSGWYCRDGPWRTRATVATTAVQRRSRGQSGAVSGGASSRCRGSGGANKGKDRGQFVEMASCRLTIGGTMRRFRLGMGTLILALLAGSVNAEILDCVFDRLVSDIPQSEAHYTIALPNRDEFRNGLWVQAGEEGNYKPIELLDPSVGVSQLQWQWLWSKRKNQEQVIWTQRGDWTSFSWKGFWLQLNEQIVTVRIDLWDEQNNHPIYLHGLNVLRPRDIAVGSCQ